MIRLADWKLTRRNVTDTYELYNLAADPFESTNLESSRGDIKAALETRAQLEGLLDEPFQTGFPDGKSVYFNLSDGDADGDGDGDDFLAWQRNFRGGGSGQAAWGIPEPSSSSLFLLAALAFLIRRHA